MLYIKALLVFITHHPALAYGGIFLISLSESLALIGLIVPGTVIMFGVGAIVATGSLGLKPVLLLAAAGAIAGDGISYWLGHHYHEKLRRIWPFSRYHGMLQNGEAFFHRHGGKSVLFGRFVGPVRPVIPIVAGMLGMSPLHFGVVNVLSAIGWAFVYILPGVFFGTSLAVAGAVSTRLAMLIFILLAAMWGFIWLSRKLVLLVGRRGPIWLAALKGWAAADTPVHGVVLPVKRLLLYLFLRQQGDELFLGFLVLMLFVAGWGFLGILQDVLAKDPLVIADQAVYHFFQSLRTPWADHILVTVTELGDSFVNICIFGAVLLVLLLKHRYRTAGYWVLAILGGLSGVQSLKWLVHLPRPVALYHGTSAYGFPSGHTTMSVILFGFLAILIARGLSSTLRWGLFVSVFLISFIVAISRLYLGAHWLSGVLGGFFIGASWVALLGIAYLKKPDEGMPRRLLGLVTVLVIVIAGGWHVTQRHERDLVFYAPRYNVQSLSLAKWLGDGWRELPAWRIDMEGEWEQPLTIQWAGSPDELAQYLLTGGWQRPPALNLKNFLGMFSPDTPIEKLPVLPHLHNGRVDRLRLVHRGKDKRWVLRLWPADARIAGNNAPLFVGTIETQHRRHLTGLITAAQDAGEYDRSLIALEKELHDRFAMKRVNRRNSGYHVSREHIRVRWQGGVLLLWGNAV
ncbi:MAG TPA: phosphatase PAP2 family protein [Proteobacteria bacterium]|nr:inner membrane protein YabI [bacterium BMS3Abin14]HDL52354.1 phosphatase PAP2 family protein [Pseudomonadota bacterium]